MLEFDCVWLPNSVDLNCVIGLDYSNVQSGLITLVHIGSERKMLFWSVSFSVKRAANELQISVEIFTSIQMLMQIFVTVKSSFFFLFSSENNSHCTDSPNYRDKYKTLKRKLKFLLYVSCIVVCIAIEGQQSLYFLTDL